MAVIVQSEALARVGRLLQISFVLDSPGVVTVSGLPDWAELVIDVDGLSGVIQGIPPTDVALGNSTITINAV